jgi:hypothetical protein
MFENACANSAPSSGTRAGSLGDGAARPASKRRTRSRVTTGRKVFVEGDGNSRWARRYRDLIAAHCQDLGGVDLLSEAQLSLIRRASAIELELEQAEGKLSTSGHTATAPPSSVMNSRLLIRSPRRRGRAARAARRGPMPLQWSG